MKKFLKILSVVVVLLVLAIAVFVVTSFSRFTSYSEALFPMHPELANLASDTSPDIEIGKRIYTVRNGCVDCHGPDLSGVMVMEDGAMGSIWGANITPYKLKDLKDGDIVRAVRYGVHHTGRSLRFMPSMDFVGLSKEDLLSLVAYIRSVPAVERESHVNTYGPIARILGSLDKMPVMFPARFIDQSKGFEGKPAEGPTAEFGKYLANSCAGCHGNEYTGGPIPGGDPSWPPASNIRLGAQGWTRETFANVIKTGVSHSTGQPIRLPMPIAALQNMTETEVEALWQYLSTLK